VQHQQRAVQQNKRMVATTVYLQQTGDQKARGVS
jgi:hypothetical protein